MLPDKFQLARARLYYTIHYIKKCGTTFERLSINFSDAAIIEINDHYVLIMFQQERNSIHNYVKMNVNSTLSRGRIYAIFRHKILRNSGLGFRN